MVLGPGVDRRCGDRERKRERDQQRGKESKRDRERDRKRERQWRYRKGDDRWTEMAKGTAVKAKEL